MNTDITIAAPDVLMPGEYKPFHGTREEWAYNVINVLARQLAEIDIGMVGDRQLRVAVVPLPKTKLGQCRSSGASADKRTNFIDLSTAQASPQELVHTLLHELLHAYDDCQAGHRGRWKRWADTIGIQRIGHERGPVAEEMITTAIEAVGVPVEHVTSVHKSTTRTSQARASCPVCKRHVHIPRKLAEQGFRVACVEHGVVMQVTA